jgi:hypothetical protein
MEIQKQSERQMNAEITNRKQYRIMFSFVSVFSIICGENASAADANALAATIDRLVGEKLAAAHVSPGPRCDDATFLRRVNITLAGRIPVASDVRSFLADTDPDKRSKAIDRLLESAAYVNHQTAVWRGWLMPEAATNDQAATGVPAFEAWMRTRVRDGVRFDRVVTELLTAPLDGRSPPGRGRPVDDDPEAARGPLAFYIAKDGKPENLAASTARVFLGLQLECAQCHDHPFAKWSRDQFWGLAAFFGGIERNNGSLREVPGRREMLIPNTDRAVPATFLDDSEPEWRFKQSARATLAAWVTAPDNPFFARASANRLWALALGVGLVDPVDDLHDKNPPSHPDLLEALAHGFVESGYDIRFVLRAICRSETFQRSSATFGPRSITGGQPSNGGDLADVRLFARYPTQGLSPEQLYDSLAVAVGEHAEGSATGPLQALGSPRRQFLDTFAHTGRRTDTPTTIVQALTLMNGGLVGSATNPASARTLAAVTGLPGLSPAERVESLFLIALGRRPKPNELNRSLAHLGAGDTARYGDVFWALLNGVEFRTNH